MIRRHIFIKREQLIAQAQRWLQSSEGIMLLERKVLDGSSTAYAGASFKRRLQQLLVDTTVMMASPTTSTPPATPAPTTTTTVAGPSTVASQRARLVHALIDELQQMQPPEEMLKLISGDVKKAKEV